MHSTITIVFAVLGGLQLLPLVHGAPTHQFDEFFPAWNDMLQGIISNNCTVPYAAYLTGHIHRADGASSLVTPVIECILKEFPEFRKAEMAASAVILGLLPTILQSLGSTSAETSLLGLRKPILAVMCAAGSPAVARMSGGEFVQKIRIYMLRDKEQAHVALMPGSSSAQIPARFRPWSTVLEYVVVCGAVGNVAHLTYQLSNHAIVVFAPEQVFLLPLWTCLSVVIHVVGVTALYMRVYTCRTGDIERSRREFGFWVPSEFTSSGDNRSPKRWNWRTENIWFHITTWFLSMGTVMHTVFGALIMSSLLFFSVVDSVTIVGRYAASTIACRTVLRFELAGISEVTKHPGSQENQEKAELTWSIGQGELYY